MTSIKKTCMALVISSLMFFTGCALWSSASGSLNDEKFITPADSSQDSMKNTNRSNFNDENYIWEGFIVSTNKAERISE